MGFMRGPSSGAQECYRAMRDTVPIAPLGRGLCISWPLLGPHPALFAHKIHFPQLFMNIVILPCHFCLEREVTLTKNTDAPDIKTQVYVMFSWNFPYSGRILTLFAVCKNEKRRKPTQGYFLAPFPGFLWQGVLPD